MTTESPHRVIIERIEPRTWNLRLRDNKTDQVHEVELRGEGPWSVDLNGVPQVDAHGEKAPRQQAQVAPPPDDAITLKLESDPSTGGARVAATGRGATAWTSAQETLLGSKWFRDAKGAPVVLLDDSPTLIRDIEAALPRVKLDLSKYTLGGQLQHLDPPAASRPVRGSPKKGGLGWAGKPEPVSHADIVLRVVNQRRPNDMVSISASGVRGELDAENVQAWVDQHGGPLGPWEKFGSWQQAFVRDRPGLLEELADMFPGVGLDVGLYQRPGEHSTNPSPPVTPDEPKPVPVNKPSTEPAAPKPARKGRKRAEPAAGPGPGGLEWTPIDEHGNEGLAARWGEGQFKLLHVGNDRYGLFYERDGGGYETLKCGTLDVGKEAAAERVSGTRPAAPLDAQLARLACAPSPKTGRPSNDEITLRLTRSDSTRAVAVIVATGDRVHEWVFSNNSALDRPWLENPEHLPEIRIHDSPTLVADLRKQFPGVNIDTSAFKKLKPESDMNEATESTPRTAAAHKTPLEAPPKAPEKTPPSDIAGQDRELLGSFTSELESVLDEDDDD